jgi:two-component system, chemotaxis family, protein-glutamate methylesterase/glutaminase
MPGHDLIVIGGSAGGLEALTALVAGLPADLPAAVCVVLHLRPYAESRLAEVLARVSPIPVVTAQHGMEPRRGVIHVAVPDMHLLVERDSAEGRGVLRLTRGPRENRARPSVDPLFRSAATAYGARVIGVVLSGALDDGTAGLWAVRDRGGLAVIQDPEDALVSSMPTSALTEVGADHVAPASALGTLLGRLARQPVVGASGGEGGGTDEPDAVIEREVAMAAIDEETHQQSERYGRPSRFACPDCSGVLWEVSEDGPIRFRCETGHAYSPDSLAESQTEGVEAALWAALRAMEDQIELARLRAQHAGRRGLTPTVDRFTVQEEASQQHAAVLRALLRLDGRTGIRPLPDSRPSEQDLRTGLASGGLRGHGHDPAG